MGGGTSQMQQSIQSNKNRLLQVSRESCQNIAELDSDNITVDIKDSRIYGNLNLKIGSQVMGASCILKNALYSAITNSQGSKQSAADSNDIVSALAEMLGVSHGQNQSNNQSIINDVTQALTSLCQSKSIVRSANTTYTIDGDTIYGDFDYFSDSQNKSTNCILDNIARAELKNSQTNDQSEKISGSLGGLTGLIILIIIGGVLFKLLTSRKSSTPSQADAKKSNPLPRRYIRTRNKMYNPNYINNYN